MLKKFLKNSLLILSLFSLPIFINAQTTDEALIDRFNSFLGELNSNLVFMSDNSYIGTDISRQRTWIYQHFFDNAGIHDECLNQTQNFKDFVGIKLPYLQQEFEFVEYNFELIKIEVGNVALLKKTIRVNNSNVYAGKCVMRFSTVGDDFKIQSVTHTLTEKETLPSNFCKQKKKKNNLLLPIVMTSIGLSAYGSSFYFQGQSEKYYEDYENNLSSPTTDNLYNKANKAHHTKLILRRSGIAVTTIGAAWLITKVVTSKQKSTFSNFSVLPSEEGLTFKYSF